MTRDLFWLLPLRVFFAKETKKCQNLHSWKEKGDAVDFPVFGMVEMQTDQTKINSFAKVVALNSEWNQHE